MITRLALAFDRSLSSFWLVPVGMSVGAVILFFITFALDNSLQFEWLKDYGPPFSIDPDGARQLLSTIAGSLITVASLVFSMTLIALTVAAGNIGARLLVRYMRNRTIQITLGLFLSGFIYALLSLSAIGGSTEIVPPVSVVTAMAYAICSFVWLAFAFHDLAETIQVDRAIARLSDSLCSAIDGLKKSENSAPAEKSALPQVYLEISASETGYVQSVDKKMLKEIATATGAIMNVKVKPGVLVLCGETIIEMLSDEPRLVEDQHQLDDLQSAVIMGNARTDLDDPIFCLRLINEIATRALSPGINDLYTAMACIDHMAKAIQHVILTGLPNGILRDDDDNLLVLLSPYTFEDFVDASVEELRRSVATMPALAARLIDRLGRLSQLCDDPSCRQLLYERASRVLEETRLHDYSDDDRVMLEQAFEAVFSDIDDDESPVQQEN